MKKLTILLLSLSSLMMTSCDNDLLNQLPVDGDVVTPGQSPVTDETKMTKALNGMYTSLGHADAFGANISIFGDLISENVFVSETNDGYFRVTNGMSWTSSSNDFRQWNKLYDAVASSNDILNSTIAENANVKKLKAQAHIGRGLAYFYLLNFYAANPKSGRNPELGIPIYTGNYDMNAKYPRLSISEGYTQVIKDLEAGIVAENNTPSKKSYFSSTVAKFILSKVYLTRGTAGDYEKAYDYANQVLTTSPSAYKLINKDQLKDYFTAQTSDKYENQPETIWEVAMSSAYNPQVNAAICSFYDKGASHAAILVRKEVVDLYSSTDARLALLDATGVPGNDDPKGTWLKKYPRVMDGAQFTADVKIFRMTEALFVKWEAMTHMGQEALALSELNAFSVSRGGSAYSGDVLTAILTEKRKEFIGEGVRYFDLKRNELSIIKNTNCFGNCTTAPTDRRFVLPIPQQSINLNPLMVQNPGWTN